MAGSLIENQFFEDHCTELTVIPFIWSVQTEGPHFCLDMKMSHLKQLVFNFELEDKAQRILKFNISLNELEELQCDSLSPFANLLELNVSLNSLSSISWLSALPQLMVLNLSHNIIETLQGLECCTMLTVLDLSHNQIGSIANLPILNSLTKLHLSGNKGNPLTQDHRCSTAIRQSTTVEILDNVLLRDGFTFEPPTDLQRQMKENLKESARMAFQSKVQEKRIETEMAIHYLHSRILSLQQDNQEVEDRLTLELEAYYRYLDAIPAEDYESIDSKKVPNAIERYMFTKFWERWDEGERRQRDHPFKDLTKSEEVVQTAAWLFTNPYPPSLSVKQYLT
ncbi:uncharacterized protein LOC127580606 [Pristis pectinata]|uniref:uncharacterized protein LOC127580606 n=1 Tax=Pristis pectinata TaxID=685728 RepID=UPI00223CE83D|nr:uncharacterized protein LOC127580606 [Pristis pectinata]